MFVKLEKGAIIRNPCSFELGRRVIKKRICSFELASSVISVRIYSFKLDIGVVLRRGFFGGWGPSSLMDKYGRCIYLMR